MESDIPCSLQATRKALQREDQLTQLYRDWEGLDMHAVLAHVLYAVEPLNIPHPSLRVIPECEWSNTHTVFCGYIT